MLTFIVITLVLSLIGLAVCLNVVSPLPEYAPLMTDPDDPLMIEAEEKAKATLPQFFELYEKFPENALVKLFFVSNTDQVEHLWAEVLGREGEDSLKVRLVTPPVTHKGTIERLYTCTIADLEDWAVQDDGNRIYGGFSERAMFKIAEKQGIRLPKKLMARKDQYHDL